MPCVLLFDEHPKTVLTGSRIGRLIQNEKRDAVFYSMGIRRICASFISLMNMKPREFVCGYLKEELGASFVACGYNYRFGEGGEGDTRLLKELCDECGIGLFVSNMVMHPVVAATVRTDGRHDWPVPLLVSMAIAGGMLDMRSTSGFDILPSNHPHAY